MSGSVSWEGLDEIIRTYDLIPSRVATEAQAAIDEAITPVIKALAQYPPLRPGQTYMRTGALGRGWQQAPRRYRVGRGSVGVNVSNRVPYVFYVQVRQARMHRGRWLPVSVAQDQLRRVYGPLALTHMAGKIARALEGH